MDVSATERGGGILSQASILTMSSYSTRTSPVLRGKWILENLLNAPPPAPPPCVPALDDSKVGAVRLAAAADGGASQEPVCASCHSRMDPLGFGLENLNAIGEWRDRRWKISGRRLRHAARWPDLPRRRPNSKFCCCRIATPLFAGLIEKMLIYALGRGLERYDRPTRRSH